MECRQYALKSAARGPALMYGSLIPYITGGHTFRIAPIQAMQTRHALDSGMTRGEVAAARSNFEALVSADLLGLGLGLGWNCRQL